MFLRLWQTKIPTSVIRANKGTRSKQGKWRGKLRGKVRVGTHGDISFQSGPKAIHANNVAGISYCSVQVHGGGVRQRWEDSEVPSDTVRGAPGGSAGVAWGVPPPSRSEDLGLDKADLDFAPSHAAHRHGTMATTLTHLDRTSANFRTVADVKLLSDSQSWAMPRQIGLTLLSGSQVCQHGNSAGLWLIPPQAR